MPRISIVIAGYNNKSFLKDCLASIYNQTFKGIEVIFVDNDSTDGTIEFIRSNYPEAKVIKNQQNLGFGKATNQAIKLSSGEYVLTLNCDVELEKNFIKTLVNAFERFKDDRIGMLSGKILREDKRTIDSTGLILTKFRRFYDRGSGTLDNGRFNKEDEIFGPCAAAALYKKQMLEDIKINGEYFDEDFFLFVDDVDLAWRAQNRGWRAYYVPDALCYHARQSQRYSKSFSQYYSFRNRYFMMLKNERFGLFNIIIILLYDIPRIFYMLYTNRKTAKVLCDIVRFAGIMVDKRRLA